MLPASARCVPVFMATPTSACASRRRVIGAVAAHPTSCLGLLVANSFSLSPAVRLREEVIDAASRRSQRRHYRVVAG